MFTPQQIDQISFTQARKGYNMEEVDAFLEPLTEDYVTLYKENGLLKSKMRVLVGKLEEYRKSEAGMKDAMVNAQRTCDRMVREAEEKCARMMKEANANAASAARNAASADSLVAAENARVEEARRTAAARINEIQEQMRTCIQALERIKGANAPAAEAPAAQDSYDSDAVADQISQSLEALVGTAEETAPKAEPRHPVRESTTSKFASLNLQFGRNYDPTHK
ncbi:MAG: DivIVA domain-containing protein [Candidatus Faecousia sp.]|nr:DivIVA domain-containing protein [Candidatus Faecousia sp.]